MSSPYVKTARELVGQIDALSAAKSNRSARFSLPPEFLPQQHLIVNTAATLEFNSPGAQGFGVKRAGLSVPGSVMLLVAPRCCGRNTSALSGEADLKDRFAYLLLDDKDIITGRHLPKIAEAAELFVASRQTAPTALMICITCVDALLGTDMERVSRQVEERIRLPVRPCYMYALTRESHRPPMAAVRETVYSLLKPGRRQNRAVNLLGFFSPLDEDAELYALLREGGLKYIRELARAKDFAAYQELAMANFNLVLNPEARGAAAWFRRNLGIGSAELTRMYQIDKIHTQYQILAQTLKVNWNDSTYLCRAQAAANRFCLAHRGLKTVIGSRISANPFELALALTRYGLTVTEILCVPSAYDYFYLKKLAELSPQTKIYNHLAPIMLNFAVDTPAELAIGKDAAYYHPEAAAVSWQGDAEPFGYSAVRNLFAAIEGVFA